MRIFYSNTCTVCIFTLSVFWHLWIYACVHACICACASTKLHVCFDVVERAYVCMCLICGWQYYMKPLLPLLLGLLLTVHLYGRGNNDMHGWQHILGTGAKILERGIANWNLESQLRTVDDVSKPRRTRHAHTYF